LMANNRQKKGGWTQERLSLILRSNLSNRWGEAQWSLTWLAIFFAGIVVVSTGCAVIWGCGPQVRRHVVITSGAVRITAYQVESGTLLPQTSSWRFSGNPPGPTRWFIFWRPIWQPSPGFSLYIIPLWIPSILFAIPASLMWGIRFSKKRTEEQPPLIRGNSVITGSA